MKNKLTDLNNHLFIQLERLNDEDIAQAKLQEEIQRARAICAVASQIISNARLALDAEVASADRLIKKMPEMLGISHESKGNGKKIHSLE